ncbi:programmed cell death protein 7-like [Tubulanus polymorphus]|uniref:programmed cell death protein 7-like n=1 Tax=Tubulanus polymorphus TaxID=672921 RepID=UPI003DA636FD
MVHYLMYFEVSDEQNETMMMEQLREGYKLLNELEKQKITLQQQECVDEPEKWTQVYQAAIENKTKLTEVLSGFDERFLVVTETKLKKRRKKRELAKRRRERDYLDRQEQLRQRAELHQKIDQWQASISHKISDAKRKKELNEQADKVLAEVRQKLNDVNRNIDFIKTLVKLRKLRKEAAVRKGLYTPTDCDEKFESRSAVLMSMLELQKKDYTGEQRTLEAMLVNEQLENLKKEEAAEERSRVKKEKVVRRKIFGRSDSPMDMSDPLYMFKQYYLQAEFNPAALVQIRKEWDFFLVPQNTPGSSTVPMSWVLPAEPSSAGWATALKK